MSKLKVSDVFRIQVVYAFTTTSAPPPASEWGVPEDSWLCLGANGSQTSWVWLRRADSL